MMLRPATKDDAFYFYQLRIDPIASRMSRRRAPTWEEHMAWWERTSDHRYVAMADGAPVGTLRLAADGVVSIIVDPIYRGLGFGPLMLQELDKHAMELGIRTLIAEVAYENERSQRAFAKAGWVPVLWEKHV